MATATSTSRQSAGKPRTPAHASAAAPTAVPESTALASTAPVSDVSGKPSRTATLHALALAREADREASHRYDIAKARKRQARRAKKAAHRAYRAAQRVAVRDSINIEPTDYFGEHHPRLRGWMHAGMFPLVVGATVTLICLAPTGIAKLACSLYAATSMLLFGISACLHLIPWHSKRKHDAMCRIDYSNIFLTIAGTNTPIALALPDAIRWPYLAIIWGTAIAGLLAHVLWKNGPDWFFTIIYCILGLAAAVLLPLLWNQPAAGPAVCWLIIAGGACYIAGAVCFALRKPIFIPGWFEYHELFHLGTLLGWSCHCVAVYFTVLSL